MAILRLSDGRVFTTYADINRVTAPLQVGTFDLSGQVLAKAAGFEQPLSQADAMYLLDSISAKDIAMVEAEGFKYNRIGNLVPQPDGSFLFALRDRKTPEETDAVRMTEKEIAEYLTPHRVMVNDWHFVFSGAIIKGVWLSDDLQGVVYCPAGGWIRLSPDLLNWPIFPVGQATTAASFFDIPCDDPFDMKMQPEVKVDPTMKF